MSRPAETDGVPPTGAEVFVIDDESVVCRSCQRILEDEGHRVTAFQDPRAAIAALDEIGPDIALVDLKMPLMDGIAVLREIRQHRPETEVVIVTGFAEVDTAVQAMKLGAFDYVQKPFSPDQLIVVVSKALEHRALRDENRRLHEELGRRYRFDDIVGSGPRMQAVYRMIERVAPTDSTVLIRGESGTGKELIARAIHHNSARRTERFLAVDCGALSETVLESEMFGHVKGAFTGASTARKGFFEQADGGTLFLDEIGNISLAVQARLLRVLQEREYKPVGASEVKTTDIRLIAATHRDLEKMVADGEFREDLYYRLNIFPIELPPLRDRAEDVPELVRYFVQRIAERSGAAVEHVAVDAMQCLRDYAWPGNVRELENVMQRALLLAAGDTVEFGDLPEAVRRATGTASEAAPVRGDQAAATEEPEVPASWDALRDVKKELREHAVDDIERRFLVEALRRAEGNATRAAEAVGMLRSNFQALMRKHGVRREEL